MIGNIEVGAAYDCCTKKYWKSEKFAYSRGGKSSDVGNVTWVTRVLKKWKYFLVRYYPDMFGGRS